MKLNINDEKCDISPVFQNLVTMYECCVLNSTGASLIVLMHATIQFVYCHYMNDQSTSYGAEDKCSSVQQIRVQTPIAFLVRYTTSASGSFSRLVDKMQVDQNMYNSL